MNKYTWRLDVESPDNEISVKGETFEDAAKIAKTILDASAFSDNYENWTHVKTELDILGETTN